MWLLKVTQTCGLRVLLLQMTCHSSFLHFLKEPFAVSLEVRKSVNAVKVGGTWSPFV